MSCMTGFENYQLSAWHEDGLIKKIDDFISVSVHKVKKHLKNSKKIVTEISSGRATTIVTSLISENSTITNSQIVEYIQKEDLSIYDQLKLSLSSLRNMSTEIIQNQDNPPTKFSLSVVSWMIDKLPPLNGLATLGLDFDGELYFKFITHNSKIYLSLEQPNLMHLLISYNDGTKCMLDDIPFKKGTIPIQVTQKLTQL